MRRSPPRSLPDESQQQDQTSVSWLNSQKKHHNPGESHAIIIRNVEQEGPGQDLCYVDDGSGEQISVVLQPHPDPMVKFMAVCVEVLNHGTSKVCILQMCQQVDPNPLDWLAEYIQTPPQPRLSSSLKLIAKPSSTSAVEEQQLPPSIRQREKVILQSSRPLCPSPPHSPFKTNYKMAPQISEGRAHLIASEQRDREELRRQSVLRLQSTCLPSKGVRNATLLADIEYPPMEGSFVNIHVLVTNITSFTYKGKFQQEQTALKIHIQDSVNNEDTLTVWSNFRREIADVIRENRTYFIQRVRVTRPNTDYKGRNWNLGICRESRIEDVSKINPISQKQIKMLSCFQDILSITEDSSVNVNAISLTVGDIRTFPKDDSTSYSMVQVTIMDQVFYTIMISFWNAEIGKAQAIPLGIPVFFTHLVIKERDGVLTLSWTTRSTMEAINDDSIKYPLLEAYRRYNESPNLAITLIRQISPNNQDFSLSDVGKHIKKSPVEKLNITMRVLVMITYLSSSSITGSIVVATCDLKEHFGCHLSLDDSSNVWTCTRKGQTHSVVNPIFRWRFTAILVDTFGHIPAEVWEPPSVGERLLNKKREEISKLNPLEQGTLLAESSANLNCPWSRCTLRITTENNAASSCTLIDFQLIEPNEEQIEIRERVKRGEIPEWNALTPNVIQPEDEDSIEEMNQESPTGRKYFTQKGNEGESPEGPPEDSLL
jgi:hypothetical protein